MTVGFVVSFFDFRNDIRNVITEASKNHNVVIFGKKEHESTILQHISNTVTYRTIDERKQTWFNTFWEYAYLFLKKIPRSRSNFFLMGKFKISNLNLKGIKKWKAEFILSFQRFFPRMISYDFYLNRLQTKDQTNIEDIDTFIFATEIADDYLLARLLRNNKKLLVYVYSWDHACKNSKFSKRVNYGVWNSMIGEDVKYLQHVDDSKIHVTGASQLGYVDTYRKSNHQPKAAFDYIYFGCAIGITSIVDDEINLIIELANSLKKLRPAWKLIVRPYPVLTNWSYYQALTKYENILLDDAFKTNDLSTAEINIQQKFAMIEGAKAFFHLGTTLGLEACFTNTPSFILNFGYHSTGGLSLYSFIHQYQNEKYLIHAFPANCVNSIIEFEAIITQLDSDTFTRPNQIIPERFPVTSFTEFTETLITASAND